MPRRKLSEYKAKQIFILALNLPYQGWQIRAESTKDDIAKIGVSKEEQSTYVVKVDQAIKGRFKKGLVELDVSKNALPEVVIRLQGKGYEYLLIEPYYVHAQADERYLSIAHDRQGIWLSYSDQGGVDIESNPKSITRVRIDNETIWQDVANHTGFSISQLHALVETYRKNYCTFLEINPYTADGRTIRLLDLAVEVDDAGLSFVPEWSMKDIREPKKILTPEEIAVRALDKGSMASFNLSVINPEGAIFLLLSGGGASVVVADEIFNKGFGSQLANYGEYSGNPSTHEAEKYTAEVLKLLLASPAPKKVLFIGGAVANFTDIANTFAGVIAALEAKSDELKKQQVSVYVRRGGPRQEIGLKNIREALEKLGILGGVYDPSTSISEALSVALKELK